MNFIDIAKIYVKAGDGGAGHISFRKEKLVPNGGPDGGDGGRGGDVIFVSEPQLNTLLDFRFKRKFLANDGVKGGKYKCTGRDGADVIIKVPTGTVIKDVNSDEILADLDKPNQKLVFLRGGIGGRGNAEFPTATNQAPRYAEPGRPGAEMELMLELKLLADVGLVGFPNAGKSTFISVVSAAKPKIADYPFTTLVPNLGIVQIGLGENYMIADIPGIIEGAHAGKGLGIQFLRHIERTKVLLFMLDSSSPDPKREYETLCYELSEFSEELDDKKRIICFTKVDLIDEERKQEILETFEISKKLPTFFISSIVRDGVEELKMALWKTVKAK